MGSGNISYLALLAMRELSISISSINNQVKQYLYMLYTILYTVPRIA